MKMLYFLCLLILLSIGQALITACGKASGRQYGEHVSKKQFNDQADSLLLRLSEFQKAVLGGAGEAELLGQFVSSRAAYKEIEAVAEYFFQGLTKRVNGPALPDVKTEDGQVWPPHGFQVIEQLLYGGYHDSLRGALSNEIGLLQADIKFIQSNMREQAILLRHADELMQHELIRIATLGISGFDAPLSKNSLVEAGHSIKGLMHFFVSYYGEKSSVRDVSAEADKALAYLKKNVDFDGFDRLVFLREYLLPLSERLRQEAFGRQTKNEDSLFIKPFSGTLADLVRGKGFNGDYYTNYATGTVNPEKIELGKRLFYDKQLSASGTISCGSCHKPETFFTDGQVKAVDFVHGGKLQRNTPGLYYAALQSHQFYDMRSVTLEDQVDEVMKNKSEFNFSASGITRKIREDKSYQQLFRTAFKLNADTVSSFELRNALGAYIRSLSPFSSRFDAYMKGENVVFTEEEKTGFNLFMGKAKCGTCHFMPLFNGNIPPWYTRSESEIIGVPSKALWKNAVIDEDPGRYAINQMEELRYAFKTPTVRNAEKTGPYMHNGVYKTLDEVVEFYHVGGGKGIGISIETQTLPFDSLVLNNKEKKAIVSFMHALTDTKTFR